MARPNKQGVDYFPLDVHLDDKFKFIEIKYKLEGFAIVVKLLQKIYSYGYWYKWTEDESYLFADEIRADPELICKVIEECIKRDVFSAEMYEKHSILTSKGIQKRFKEIVRRRKEVEVITEYLLIDGIFGVNDVINPSTSKQNDVKSTQRIVNKTDSKLENSKQKESSSLLENEKTKKPVNPFQDDGFAKIATYYQEGLKRPLLPATGERLGELLDDFKNADLIIEAFKETAEREAEQPLPYARTILNGWRKKSITTLELLKAHRERENSRNASGTRSGSYLAPSQETMERTKRELEEFEKQLAAGEIELEVDGDAIFERAAT